MKRWWVEMRSKTWAETRFPGPASPLGVEWQSALWSVGGREAREKAGRPVWRPEWQSQKWSDGSLGQVNSRGNEGAGKDLRDVLEADSGVWTDWYSKC